MTDSSRLPLARRRPAGHRLGVLAVAAVVVLLLVALGVAVAQGPGGSGAGGSTGPGGAAMNGKPAPSLTGTTLGGQHFRLRPDGRVTVVNIWASWCGPCRAELPTLVQVQHQWHDRGVRLVTINTKDGPVAARSFLHRLHVTDLLAVSDPQGRLAVAWGATGVPETVVVDRHGVVRARWLGAVRPDWLDEELQRWTRA
ncbi:MAG TPA: redoxin family protein [Marmoricola sp.]|nr:redoxin family protein [Marmoricola sp.]